MSPTLELMSERVHAAGGFQGGGVIRLLGTPRMDDLTLLTREAVQNSWDARWPADSIGTVNFDVHLFTLDRKQRGALESLFSQLPTGGSKLAASLRRDSLLVAEIRDTGTTGLDGPTRADRAATEARNFIDFIRNIGAPQDRDESGGTYGFGKGSYYRVSDAHTILVHTRCRLEDGGTESRFIAAAVGEPFLDRDVPYTGRHFWGVRSGSNDHVEPVTGTRADEIAESVGMGVPGGSTGTSIVIIGFRTGLDVASSEDGEPRDLPSAARHIAHQLVWQCWPKMLPRADVLPMKFTVRCEGDRVDVPSLSDAPAIKAFAGAMRAVLDGEDDVVDIRSQRPRRLLGRLAFKRFSAVDPRRGFGTERAAGFVVPDHHVALLRAPELVVKYLPGPPSGLADHGWVGAFVADAKVDPSFAAAEPPSHDEWVPDQVADKRQRRDVNVALREINAEVKARFALPTRAVSGSGSATSLADLAATLGNVFRMPGLDASRPSVSGGTGGTGGTGGGQGQSTRRRARVVRQLSAQHGKLNGVPAHVVDLEKQDLDGGPSLHARVRVAVDDGAAEGEGPVGSSTPRVLGWIVDGVLVGDGPDLEPVPVGANYQIAVEAIPDLAPIVVVTVGDGRI